MSKRTILFTASCAVLSLYANGCMVPVEEELEDPEAEPTLGEDQQELRGALTLDGCNSAQSELIRKALRIGNVIADDYAFMTCLESGFPGSSVTGYEACDDDDNPTTLGGWIASRSVKNIKVRCVNKSRPTAGSASVHSHGFSGDEDIKLARWYLDDELSSSSSDTSKATNIASAIWHEVMHNWGYRHGDVDDLNDARNDCGQDASWNPFFHSMPYLTTQCLQGMGWDFVGDRLSAQNPTGSSWEHGLLEKAVENIIMGADDNITRANELTHALWAAAQHITLRPHHSQMCLDVHGNRAEQRLCHGGYVSQRWSLVPLGSRYNSASNSIRRREYAIVNRATGLCLDRPWGHTSNHTPVNLYPCHGGPAQRWRLYWADSSEAPRALLLEAPWTGQCLDIPGYSTAPNTGAQMYQCKSVGTRDNQLLDIPTNTRF